MSDTEKKADEIIEETMKEIFDDLNDTDAFESNEEDFEEGDFEPDFAESGENNTEYKGDSFEDAEELFEDEEELNGEDSEELFFDESEEEDSDPSEEKSEKRKKRRKTAAIVLGSILGVLIIVYVGFVVYFNSHFLFNTKINGNNFSLQNVSKVESFMEKEVQNYTLTLKEADGKSEVIDGSDISLEYVPGDAVEQLVKEQNKWLWIASLWKQPEIEAQVGVKYNEEKLTEVISGLDCLVPENQTASVDAHPEFQNGQFVVVDEVVGTQIDTDAFQKKVAEAINGFHDTLNLTEEGCYMQPKFTKESSEVIAAADAMNSYLGANITYDFNPHTEVVDASVISQWVKVDADMNVTFDQEAVKAFIKSLADKYDTKGKQRTITTAAGNTATVSGGSYGWKIDQEAEYNALTANIQNAETVSREPNYSSRAASHDGNDYGSTYAEVDLTNQKMYFVQNGQVVLQSDVVTGNPNKGNATPQGVYSLAYKQTDKVLRGTKRPDGTYEYETPVKYWMPFNGGIGFHDATWQSSFGGSRYLSHGSHGCVNMPYNAAGQLYNLISAGTPVVCHF